MKSGFEHRIYNYEVAPPAHTWEKISAELDDSELNASFPQKLKAFIVPPPPEAWSKIASLLYGSSFIHDYATRLESMEVTPPVSVWENIKSGLDKNESRAETSRKIIPWYRYAAAAAIIGLLVWAGSRFLNSKTAEPELAKESTVPTSISPTITNNLPVAQNDVSKPAVDNTEDARDDAALEASKKTFAKLDSKPSSKIKHASEFFFAAASDESLIRGLPDFESEEMEHLNINNRYIVLMTPEGNIIRMSKKLGDLVCCVSGEDEEKDCTDQMKKWREKIAYAPSGHSPGNFLELLNLVCSLQEN